VRKVAGLGFPLAWLVGGVVSHAPVRLLPRRAGAHDRVIRGPGCSVRSSGAAGLAHAVLRAHPGLAALHGLGHDTASAVVAAWPAAALVGSYELLMVIICDAQVPADVPDVAGVPDRVPDADRLQVQAAQEFAAELATGRVPSVRGGYGAYLATFTTR
jgi:hypothetical protein